MPRKPRIQYPGAVYHVILRGNAGDPVFFTDLDRYRLYLFLQHAVEQFACRIHAFCLMTNHIHLVMQIGEISLSHIMQNISLRYTKWINYCQGRTGHVFQGRYKAILIDAEVYLLELVRYVHLNPVRSGLAATADDWRWSGHRAYCGNEIIPWLSTDWVLAMFSAQVGTARKEYISYVDGGRTEGKRGEFQSGTWEGRLLGDDYFIDTALEKAGEETPRAHVEVADVVTAVCQVYGCSLENLAAPGKVHPFSEARAVASYVIQQIPTLQLTDLGHCLHRDIDSLGRAGRKVGSAAAESPKLQVLLERVQKLVEEKSESLA